VNCFNLLVQYLPGGNEQNLGHERRYPGQESNWRLRELLTTAPRGAAWHAVEGTDTELS
jgi:hypothetical protein